MKTPRNAGGGGTELSSRRSAARNVFQVAGEIHGGAFSDRRRPELFVEMVEPEIVLHLTAQLPARKEQGSAVLRRDQAMLTTRPIINIASASPGMTA